EGAGIADALPSLRCGRERRPDPHPCRLALSDRARTGASRRGRAVAARAFGQRLFVDGASLRGACDRRSWDGLPLPSLPRTPGRTALRPPTEVAGTAGAAVAAASCVRPP